MLIIYSLQLLRLHMNRLERKRIPGVSSNASTILSYKRQASQCTTVISLVNESKAALLNASDWFSAVMKEAKIAG
jgi:hypothetical protein